MSSPARYPVPAAAHRVEEEIRRSRFITTIAPAPTVDDAMAFVRRVSGEFADATHNCWAYAVGPPGDTGRVGMSDAGEPHGTAGRPMLAALLHSGLGDIAVVVSRYYGGTKLGSGGLVRAYGGGVQKALATLPRGERIEHVTVVVGIEYSKVTTLQQLLPDFEAEVVSQVYEADVRLLVRLPRENAGAFKKAVLDATHGQASLGNPGEPP